MNALVVNTGMRTYFGKTAKLVEEVKTQSHFQKAIVKIGDYLIFLAIGLVIIIFLVSIFRGQNVLGIIQSFRSSVNESNHVLHEICLSIGVVSLSFWELKPALHVDRSVCRTIF